MDRFEAPNLLWLLVLVVAIPLARMAWARVPVISFSALDASQELRPSWRGRIAFLPGLLMVLAMASLVLAVARPQNVEGQTRISTEGVAIEMIIDRSASMTAPMMHEGDRLTRFEVVKRVFAQFVNGDGGALDGRKGDMIGLIVFAGFADTVCPLVRSYGVLTDLALNTQPAPPSMPEGGTAIGDALALAAARLQTAEEQIQRLNNKSDEPPEFTIKSKVIILLTDGEHNRGDVLPLEAAEKARDWGIKVYTIGIGGTGGVVYIPGNTPGSRMPIRDRVDERTLSAIAEMTGGVYWNARNAQALKQVYAELGELEQTNIGTVEYTRVEERFQPYAIGSGLFLAFSLLLSSTILRRLP